MSPTKQVNPILDRYTDACTYPGRLDEAAVEAQLHLYLGALGIKRKVERIRQGWTLADHPSLIEYVRELLKKIAPGSLDALDARDARAARDALAALAPANAAMALHRFASWCIHRGGWWYWHSDVSAYASIHVGAQQLNSPASVQSWTKPIYEAFLAGCWLLHWTEDTLFWVAKPTVHVEKTENGRRLHNDQYAALESDLENIYFWHGVMVPAFVVTQPEWITLEHIAKEENAEVRRILIERYGLTRYLLDSGAKKIAEDEFGELYRSDLPGDESLVMVKVMNSTPESDGSLKPYFLRVHPELRLLLQDGLGESQKLTPLNAVASTFGMTGEQYLKQLVAQT